MRVTEWFEPHTKPVHIGWYHTSWCDYDPKEGEERESSMCWWWDGSYWRAAPQQTILGYQDRWWRGIAK